MLMLDTATEPVSLRRHHRPPSRSIRLQRFLWVSGLLLTIQACTNTESSRAARPDPQLKASSCLEDLSLKQLDKALDHCNAVVESHPDNPVPLTDRSLIHTLMGNYDNACADVSQAASLLKRRNGTTDPLLRHELNVRQQSCKQRATMTGNG